MTSLGVSCDPGSGNPRSWSLPQGTCWAEPHPWWGGVGGEAPQGQGERGTGLCTGHNCLLNSDGGPVWPVAAGTAASSSPWTPSVCFFLVGEQVSRGPAASWPRPPRVSRLRKAPGSSGRPAFCFVSQSLCTQHRHFSVPLVTRSGGPDLDPGGRGPSSPPAPPPPSVGPACPVPCVRPHDRFPCPGAGGRPLLAAGPASSPLLATPLPERRGTG